MAKLDHNKASGPQEFLNKLNFQNYFPRKLSLQDSLVISNHIKPNIEEGTDDPHHLLHLMLEQIKMASYKFRKVVLYDKKKPTADSDSDASDSEESHDIIIHPMDSLLALIHCADDFLRQDIFLKLTSCQTAVPLLLPDLLSNEIILPVWAMRNILKHWKTKVSDSKWIACEDRLVECEVAMVSFMRFSHPGQSKSKILNSVINDSSRDFFFNHHCQGSSVKRLFVDGLVEMCWYLPTGEKSDLFDDIIAFTNLRGNAGHKTHARQLKFLLSHSFVSFIFILERDITNENFKALKCLAKGKIFFLMKSCNEKNAKLLKQLVPNSAIILIADKEPAAVVKSIRSRITSKMSKDKSPLCRLTQCVNSADFQIAVDENKSSSCSEGKRHAEEIVHTIQDIEAFKVKDKMVPLHGPNLWHKWATHNKRQNRAKQEDTGEQRIEKFLQEQENIKLKIRQEQYSNAKHLSFAMDKFTESLTKFSSEVRAYFLQWLKIFLDDRSRLVLPALQDACKSTRDKLRNKELTEDQKKALQAILHDQDVQLINASFGVEHLFRELGQIYESSLAVNKASTVKIFPKVAAELLLAGHPLEIVDGDAAHIPIKWVQAVLTEVKSIIGMSKLFVLSVLGIQSTGKSTLMNTMFGVRFSVSAGCCTRGAYLQLLKLQTNDDRKGDYMLIIDTEGLRAPELDSSQTQQHDNELAALVIGLAGVTIVNMFGEVPADISDILQTTVHAFLRMKKAEMQHTPSCQFVRHHVANVSASKTSEGSDRFQETLNNMTKIAAKAEHYGGQFDQFSDVITFDNKTDVQNFPSLWEGNPPMAPVNPSYCEAAQNLREKFLTMAKKEESLCTLQEFQMRLEALWNAILKENFVFSFKNTLEVEAFNCLDTEYGKWSWRLQSCVINWESSAKTDLTSAAESSLVHVQEKQVKLIRQKLDSEFDEIMAAIDAFLKTLVIQ